MAVAIEGRLRTSGLKADKRYPSFEDIKTNREGMTGDELARSNILGNPLNKLQHWGYITVNQGIAGHDFALTIRDYLATAKLLKPTQGKAGFVPATPDNSDGPPVKGEAKARAFMEALAEVDRSDPLSSPSATSVVWKACIDEVDIFGAAAIGALRVGLNALVRIQYGRKAA